MSVSSDVIRIILSYLDEWDYGEMLFTLSLLDKQWAEATKPLWRERKKVIIYMVYLINLP
jgi:hypothetical protein